MGAVDWPWVAVKCFKKHVRYSFVPTKQTVSSFCCTPLGVSGRANSGTPIFGTAGASHTHMGSELSCNYLTHVTVAVNSRQEEDCGCRVGVRIEGRDWMIPSPPALCCYRDCQTPSLTCLFALMGLLCCLLYSPISC